MANKMPKKFAMAKPTNASSMVINVLIERLLKSAMITEKMVVGGGIKYSGILKKCIAPSQAPKNSRKKKAGGNQFFMYTDVIIMS